MTDIQDQIRRKATDRIEPAEPEGDVPEVGGGIHRHVTDEGVCVLTFDRPNAAANIFDRTTMEELDQQLAYVENEKGLRGLVLLSAKESIFIAGADIHALARVSETGTKHVPDLADLIQLGQDVFSRLSNLATPSVAAIHGACVGGGYEVCLACDHRIASPDRVTRVGLPEVNLGILPAWGGATRLPRLIGLPRALGVILGGKVLAAKQALKYGMVDELAPREYLLSAALRRLQMGKAQPRSRFLLNKPPLATLIGGRARGEVIRKSHGHYPAPLKALDVVTRGARLTELESFQLEREAVKELVQTEACRNLIRIYLLQEKARKKRKGVPVAGKVGRVAVIGAGVMGAGIAQWLSSKGIQVVLRDIHAEALNRGMLAIDKLYRDGQKRRKFTSVEARSGLDRIHPIAGDSSLARSEIIIEAAVEKMELKKALFQKLDQQSSSDTILATNTSALSLADIAGETSDPGRVVGIHFFNPVHRMQLVEVIRGEQTEEEVVHHAVQFVQQIGKLPVVVKDSPGFLVNRVLMPYLVEAGSLFEKGASVNDLDACMLDFGMPMGPLRLIDEVGVDVSGHVAETLAGHFGERLQVPVLLKSMMRDGRLGRKSGLGFYRYQGSKSVPDAGTGRYRKDSSATRFSRNQLQQRMVLLMVNEAARCLEERVVPKAEDVDFGMIMGAGFAPFKGGPLRYADSVGITALAGALEDWAGTGESQFKPCDLLQRMAADGGTFYQPAKEE